MGFLCFFLKPCSCDSASVLQSCSCLQFCSHPLRIHNVNSATTTASALSLTADKRCRGFSLHTDSLAKRRSSSVLCRTVWRVCVKAGEELSWPARDSSSLFHLTGQSLPVDSAPAPPPPTPSPCPSLSFFLSLYLCLSLSLTLCSCHLPLCLISNSLSGDGRMGGGVGIARETVDRDERKRRGNGKVKGRTIARGRRDQTCIG